MTADPGGLGAVWASRYGPEAARLDGRTARTVVGRLSSTAGESSRNRFRRPEGELRASPLPALHCAPFMLPASRFFPMRRHSSSPRIICPDFSGWDIACLPSVPYRKNRKNRKNRNDLTIPLSHSLIT